MIVSKKAARAWLSLALALLLCGPIAVYAAPVPDTQRQQVLAGGMPFGVKLQTDGVMVVGFVKLQSGASPAKAAGIAVGDTITAIDDVPVTAVEQVTEALDGCQGKALTLTLRRKTNEEDAGQLLTLSLTPVMVEGSYRAGLRIRSTAAGIGTVTYVDPRSLSFAGLGHGICDPDTGILLPLGQGRVYDVALSEAKKGKVGEPGELQGKLEGEEKGALLGNTAKGVYGVLTALPSGAKEGALVPFGYQDEIHAGAATILCTVDGSGEIGEYTVELSKLDLSGDRKNFVVTVTDPALLAATGGIVQGMSGSPIIQDGKLVGAVTHVLVGDPTRGYGICIENMPKGE